jgi:PhzF family phenazine biosynthesis protein
MDVEHIAAFSATSSGGNPAGVVIGESLPAADEMQRIARQVGYSETVFAAPQEDGWRVRYFSPLVEVDFCGHATIALGAALAKRQGSGTFRLQLNRATITVDGRYSQADWSASFRSPATKSCAVRSALLEETLQLFALREEDLDRRIPPALAHAGADHLVLALQSRDALRQMDYDIVKGQALAQRESLTTFCLIHAEQDQHFHVRNPFPLGGVFEDPATGAAAAALGGYLRDMGWPHEGSIRIDQGDDMGVPCRIRVDIGPQRGEGIQVSGNARLMTPP